MSKPQFMHIETYPVSRSVLSTGSGNMQTAFNILAEAARLEGHISHIQEPLHPVILVGQRGDPREQLQDFLDENKQAFINKDGKKVERKIAKTTHVLIAAVYSSPIPCDSADLGLADALFRDCLVFHETELGAIHLAYKHIDESYLHIHCFTFSTNAKKLHPGLAAKEEKGQGAYNPAMRAFQDRFYEQVSIKHGLERKGIGYFRIQNKHMSNVKKQSQKELDEWYEDELAKRKNKLRKKELEQKAMSEAEIKRVEEALRNVEKSYIDSKEYYMQATAQLREEIQWLETHIEEAQTSIGSDRELWAENVGLHTENQRLTAENKQLKEEVENLLKHELGPR